MVPWSVIAAAAANDGKGPDKNDKGGWLMPVLVVLTTVAFAVGLIYLTRMK